MGSLSGSCHLSPPRPLLQMCLDCLWKIEEDVFDAHCVCPHQRTYDGIAEFNYLSMVLLTSSHLPTEHDGGNQWADAYGLACVVQLHMSTKSFAATVPETVV